MNLKKSFLEKYRPREEEDIVGNQIIKERIFGQLKKGMLVNMLFYGESGIGKTTTAEAIARKFLGDHYHTDCITINCSDKTGVDYVRKEIIGIAELKPRSGIRIFLMEECEELSKKAQNALKKPMEAPYDKSNRFIFLCNNISKMSDAIKDRCRIYNYMKIRPSEMIERLKYIAKEEKIPISDEMIENLSELSNGSMRYPIIQLEELKSLDREITNDDIRMEKSLGSIKEIFVMLKEKKIPMARNKVLDLYQNGSTFNDVIRYFHDFTILSLGNNMNYKAKASTLVKIAETEKNVKEGCNEFIQITFLLSNISLLLQNKGSD